MILEATQGLCFAKPLYVLNEHMHNVVLLLLLFRRI